MQIRSRFAGGVNSGFRSRIALALALVLFAGCARESQPPPAGTSHAPSDSVPPPQAVTAAPASDAASAAPDAQQQDAAKPASETFFVGHWAASEAACADAAWVITEQGLKTPGEVSCHFQQLKQTSRGTEADAMCTAEGTPGQWTLRFSYAQSARALLIEGGPFADIGLVRCESSVSPPPPGTPGGLPDDRTPISEAPFTKTSAQGAGNVVQTYYALVAAGRYEDARRLWTQGGEGSGMSAEEFAQSFAEYESYNANIGAPGRVEGAAGSLYVSVPVQIYGRRKSGQPVHMLGTATLRRSNDVPGSTEEQREWHIYRIDLKPTSSSG
jgi:hypothetical protein